VGFITGKGRITVVNGDAWYKGPVPGGEDVFVLVAADIGVASTVREVEAEGLRWSGSFRNEQLLLAGLFYAHFGSLCIRCSGSGKTTS
jgi:hypothetical protein